MSLNHQAIEIYSLKNFIIIYWTQVKLKFSFLFHFVCIWFFFTFCFSLLLHRSINYSGFQFSLRSPEIICSRITWELIISLINEILEMLLSSLAQYSVLWFEMSSCNLKSCFQQQKKLFGISYSAFAQKFAFFLHLNSYFYFCSSTIKSTMEFNKLEADQLKHENENMLLWIELASNAWASGIW